VLGVGKANATRDMDGLIGSLSDSYGSWNIERDGTGRLIQLKSLDFLLQIQRDALGRPLVWSGSGNATVTVQRDVRGRVVGERESSLLIHRDTMGRMNRATLLDSIWSWRFDAGGRVLQTEAPSGTILGNNRLPGGLLERIRYPDGGYTQFFRDGRIVIERNIGANGKVLDQVKYGYSRSGLLQWKEVDNQKIWLRRDALDELVAVDSGEILHFSRTPDGLFDELTGYVSLDESGHIVDAETFDGVALWHLPPGYLHYLRDPKGRVDRVISGS